MVRSGISFGFGCWEEGGHEATGMSVLQWHGL